MSPRYVRLLALLALTACKRTPPPAPEPVAPVVHVDAAIAVDATHVDAARLVDAGPHAALTIRVINASTQPLPILTNQDNNEMVHTRKLYPRRLADAATYAASEGELMKFFTVGQEPLCSTDGGAGYGGIGQPERRTLAPGEAIEFAWDGQLRREVVQRERGVCVELGTPEPGRYRFEFDQPYNMPQCNRPIVVLPLAADAPPTIEIRCVPRPHAAGEEHGG